MVRISSLKGYEEIRDYYYLDEDLEIVSRLDGVIKLKSRLNSSGYISYPLIKKDGNQMTVLLHRVIAGGKFGACQVWRIQITIKRLII